MSDFNFYEWMQRYRAQPNEVDKNDDTQGEADPPLPGVCVVGPHIALRTWLVPRDGNRYCLPHLQRIVHRAGWPWRKFPPAG